MVLKTKLWFLAMALVAFVGGTDLFAADPPLRNVLLIIADDHRADAFGAAGDKLADTPTLDRIANEGMRFTNAYSVSPGDPTGRIAILTGQYPISLGLSFSHTTLSDEVPTLGNILLTTEHTGGMFVRTSASGRLDFSTDDRVKFGFMNQFGFKDLWATVQVDPVDPSIPVQSKWRPFHDPAREWLNAKNLPYGATLKQSPTLMFASRLYRYWAANPSRSGLHLLSTDAPRSPFYYPVEFADRYSFSQFDAPEVPDADRPWIPDVFKNMTDLDTQGVLAAYHTSIAFLDATLKLLIDRLGEEGHLASTIIIYTSDNGLLMGEHGWFEKHALYEPAIRVPLLVWWPGVVEAGSVSDALVETIDLFPTICDMFEARVPGNITAQSLMPILTGQRVTGRQSIMSEYRVAEQVAIRDAQFKLIYSTGQRERKDGFEASDAPKEARVQLFDLRADPQEHVNLAGNPVHQETLERMKALLMRRVLDQMPEGSGLGPEASYEDHMRVLLSPPEVRDAFHRQFRRLQHH